MGERFCMPDNYSSYCLCCQRALLFYTQDCLECSTISQKKIVILLTILLMPRLNQLSGTQCSLGCLQVFWQAKFKSNHDLFIDPNVHICLLYGHCFQSTFTVLQGLLLILAFKQLQVDRVIILLFHECTSSGPKLLNFSLFPA